MERPDNDRENGKVGEYNGNNIMYNIDKTTVKLRYKLGFVLENDCWWSFVLPAPVKILYHFT